MKKILLFFLCCLLLTGCAVTPLDTEHTTNETTPEITDTKPADTTALPSDTLPTTDTIPDGIGGDSTGFASDNYHHEMYYAIDLEFTYDFLSKDEFSHFRTLFDGTKNFNYRGFCEYYGITHAEFESYWEYRRGIHDQSYLVELYTFEYLYIMEHHYDEWFADDYESNPVFMATDTYPDNIGKTYIAKERSEDYTIRYYTIDYMLVEAVGDTEFEKYLQTAEEINILTFLAYFDITKDEYLEIYKVARPKPYNAEYLFSTDPAMIDEYFKVHKDLRIQ